MMKSLSDLAAWRFGLPSQAGQDQPAEGPLAAALNHRTHRLYADRPIPDELLTLLLAAAFSAPAKSDLQQASVVVVKDKSRRRQLAELVPDMPWVGAAPVFMVFLGDSRRIRRICEFRNHLFANDHLDAFLNAAVDAGMVLQNLIAMADQLGLGTCPISVIRNQAKKVAEILALPGHVFPLAGLCLGYPAREGHVSMRLPPAVTVHIDRYDDSDLEADIDAYDRRRDARFSIPPDKQRRRDEYGPVDFYGWSEDKARQVAKPERADFGAFIRAQGFCLD